MLVGGLEHVFYDFPKYIGNGIECHHPNWRTHSIIFQRGGEKPATRKDIGKFWLGSLIECGFHQMSGLHQEMPTSPPGKLT